MSPLSTELDKLYAWIFSTIGRIRFAVAISDYISNITQPLFKKTESHEDIENVQPIDELKQRMDELYNRVSAMDAQNIDRVVRKEKANRVLEDRVRTDQVNSAINEVC
uniref:Uncharacterized protein n=1 Tax=Acrobeloides nanus TaxID=290746 RepID=A0A914D9X8_9BILA